jgi:hypothetical protein
MLSLRGTWPELGSEEGCAWPLPRTQFDRGRPFAALIERSADGHCFSLGPGAGLTRTLRQHACLELSHVVGILLGGI